MSRVPRTLLVAVDLAVEHPPELAFARRLATELGAEVLLLHVVDYAPSVLPIDLPAGYPAPRVDVFQEAAEKKIAALAAGFGDVPVRTMVEVGDAAAEIVEVARREGVEQIVVGHQRGGSGGFGRLGELGRRSLGRSALSRVFLGSVATRVARSAPCPVTIVREDVSRDGSAREG